MLLYYVNRGTRGLPQGETGPRDIQMIIPLHQLRIPHIQDLKQYISPSTTNIGFDSCSFHVPVFVRPDLT